MKRKPYGVRKSVALHQHWTWKHGTMTAKKQFSTLDDALAFIEENHIKNYHPYVCPDCGMWHLGHDKKQRQK